MKKFTILTIMFLLLLSVAQGQTEKKTALKKLQGTTVSSIAKNSFIEDFGNVSNVKWRRFDTFDQATFIQNGKEMVAFYDDRGSQVGTTSQAVFTDLPASSQKDINEKYKDYKIGQVVFYKDNQDNDTDMILYGVQFEDEDNYFVEMAKGDSKIVLRVDKVGNVTLFKKL